MTKHRTWRPFAFLPWLMMALWGLLVMLLTTLPGETPLVQTLTQLIGGTEFSSVMGHMMLFLLLTVLLYMALQQWVAARYAVLVAMLFVLMLGTTTEFFQWFVTGRDSTIADLIANWLGVFVAGFLIDHLLLLRRATY
jgi:VanZ family protein